MLFALVGPAFADDTVRLVDGEGGNVLTASGPTDYSPVVVRDATDDGESSRWVEELVANGAHRYRNVATGDYLTVTDESSGSSVTSAPLVESWSSQQWTRHQAGDDVVRLQNVWTGHYLNVTGTADGAPVDASAYVEGSNGSRWSIASVAGAAGEDRMDGMDMPDTAHSGTPVYMSEAPAGLVASLGGWMEADGTVTAANTGQASGHSGHEMGHELNVHANYEAALAAGVNADQFISDFTSDNGNFNPRQTDEQKVVGALTVLNEVAAVVTMGGLEGDLDEVYRLTGNATNAALAGNGATLRQILTDAGGDVGGMTDAMLVRIWSTNSHMYNHAIVSGNGFELTHLRSLNDNAEDGTEKGTLGFYNDRGEWPQWDARTNGRSFLKSLTEGIVPSGLS